MKHVSICEKFDLFYFPILFSVMTIYGTIVAASFYSGMTNFHSTARNFYAIGMTIFYATGMTIFVQFCKLFILLVMV